MVVPGIKENSPQQQVLGSERSQQAKQAPIQRGIGQVPDRLEAPQDAACLEGIFSTLSDCLIALYEGVIYLIQLPIYWLFGGPKEEALPAPPPRPRANSDAGLEENPDWNKETLLRAIEESDSAGRLTTLLEVAEKADDKDLKVEKSEAFEIIRKLNECDPDAFTIIMTLYKKTDLPEDLTSLLTPGFNFKTFYKAVLQHQLRPTIGRMQGADKPLDKLNIFYGEIPEGPDRKLPREKRKIRETVRILMKEIPQALQKSIASNMNAIDLSERYHGALGFAAQYSDAFNMATYLASETVHLGLVREAIPQAFFAQISAGFTDAEKTIREKLTLLHYAIDKCAQSEIPTLITAFSLPEQNHAAYQQLLGDRSLEDLLADDKPAILAAINPMMEEAQETEERALLLEQLANGDRAFGDQLALLKLHFDDETLQAFVSVQEQRNQFAELIVENCDDFERKELSNLAIDMPNHPSKGSQWGMYGNSIYANIIGKESDRTKQDKAAIKDYLKIEGNIEGLSKELVKIGFGEHEEDEDLFDFY